MIDEILKHYDDTGTLSDEDIRYILEHEDEAREPLFKKSREITERYFHKKIFVRGLIEFSNYCKNNCYYCGIRRGNGEVERYRLSKEVMEHTVEAGAAMGFKTFVLQGGEDPGFPDEDITEWLHAIKRIEPDAAVTLSVGERPKSVYARWKAAGADRFLLRHESFNPEHYKKLHPSSMKREHRIQCLRDLKSLGFQVGSGFMVGSPYQTVENLVEDFRFLKELEPAMVGIGPYVTHHATPFKNFPSGSVERTAICIAILRLLFPKANLPSTTAMQTLAKDGRNRGILAGANVFMPNLSPAAVRGQYALYDDKAAFQLEAAENLEELKRQIAALGYEIVMSRGDYMGKES
ncbi:iron-only hydrogenase maturation rSAM protein HydE [Aedoeadaptatus coxii]|uniref:Iron-only hydrogenase maturation rSAM protein HydE n=1 Tax=Aedoeadaptatus coxii TaxID=755172 RepID=A0A134AHP7_9FIRM|nr:[FeFe] hydrogenase H-cluster radical SAM maturase HydE [Peptoniphilus coxii]KXB67050.1 iron-only hydrogenase maturation rSAM protein HydE [Peptoniphilus coxii]CAC9928895.1 iron-only hydrogenase maturation rSAM protein HydE [Peptoniphilus coxii]